MCITLLLYFVSPENTIFSGETPLSPSLPQQPISLSLSISLPSLSLSMASSSLLTITHPFTNPIISKSPIFPQPTPSKLNPNSLSFKKFQPLSKKNSNGGLSVLACSTSSPFIGKVGLFTRQGNFTLLSFGTNPSYLSDKEAANDDDSSQILSALLPFVVALTAVAALAQPSTFTW